MNTTLALLAAAAIVVTVLGAERVAEAASIASASAASPPREALRVQATSSPLVQLPAAITVPTAEPERCTNLTVRACEAVWFPPVAPPPGVGAFERRKLPITHDQLEAAADAAGWNDPDERTMFVRMLENCEAGLDAGTVSTDGSSFGEAQVNLGWFDQVGIPRERWWVLFDNMRAARAARNDGVAVGIGPFGHWSCAYAATMG